MAVHVSVLNRQRRQKIDLVFMRQMAEAVALATGGNLRQNPPNHLSSVFLDEFEERGRLSLVLVSNSQIQKLNRQWRQKDRPTDVLSFPLMLEPPPLELPFELGEIVISLEKAAEQAESFGHDIKRELAFLFAHGLLHVLGFDHQSPEEEKEMFGRQKAVLSAAGFNR